MCNLSKKIFFLLVFLRESFLQDIGFMSKEIKKMRKAGAKNEVDRGF